MDIGDVIECGIWTTGEESREMRLRFEKDVTDNIDEVCSMERVIRAPIVFTEKRPGDERVPPVPAHIKGMDVRLLIAEAKVIGFTPQVQEGSFVANLDRKDLVRLRRMTRDAYYKFYRKVLSTEQVDGVIEALGPETALDTLRKNVH